MNSILEGYPKPKKQLIVSLNQWKLELKYLYSDLVFLSVTLHISIKIEGVMVVIVLGFFFNVVILGSLHSTLFNYFQITCKIVGYE